MPPQRHELVDVDQARLVLVQEHEERPMAGRWHGINH